jgi:hypothetical protein
LIAKKAKEHKTAAQTSACAADKVSYTFLLNVEVDKNQDSQLLEAGMRTTI